MNDLTTTNGLEIDLASTGAKFTAVELRLPEDMPEADWAQVGRRLIRADQVVQWWLGDWAQFGAGNPDKAGWRKKGALIEFCKANRFNYANLRQLSWVSGSVHLSCRRDTVPWSFYAEIAALKPKEQKQWIDRVLDEELTRAALRKAIRIDGGKENALVSDGKSLVNGTKYFDLLKLWLLNRPEDFWIPERKAIWTARIAELIRIIDP